ncbi:MAG: VWA domain-containing protein [Spongiibacteraceae bacterium]
MPLFDHFYLLRPELFWLTLPLLGIAALLMRLHRGTQTWQRHIDPALLPYLLGGQQSEQNSKRLLSIKLLAAALALIALLGPAWQQSSVSLHKRSDGLAIVLDLSPSMLAQDLQPSRLQQAKFKIRDILTSRAEGQTGLVVFGGDAFVVAPLTDDSNTLLAQLPALQPDIMPIPGSNPLSGLEKAEALLRQSGVAQGQILLISDGANSSQLKGLRKFINSSDYPMSILGVGTAQGAPIPNPEGGFAQDERGDIIIPQLNSKALRKLAQESGGRYREVSLNDSDIESLIISSDTSWDELNSSGKSSQRKFDQWQDAGSYFVLLLLPLALLCFRRSWLPCALLTVFIGSQPLPAQADDSLWRTGNQRGAQLFDSDPGAAAKAFTDPLWQGSAHYRAENYAEAAKAFSQLDSADAHYNRGNAFSKMGELDKAIEAYEKALKLEPDMPDAQHNKALAEQLKQQQEQQDSQDGEQDQDQSQDSDSSDGDQQQSQNGEDSAQQGESQSEQSKNQQQENGEQPADPSDSEASPEQQQQAQDYAEQAADQQDKTDEQFDANKPDEQPSPQGDEASEQLAVAGEQQSEEDQAIEQWLKRIPDNPSHFLREKFNYQYRQRQDTRATIKEQDYAPY